MKCPKCNGLVMIDPPRWFGDAYSAKCLICGNRIWKEPEVAKPMPAPEPAPQMLTKAEKEQRRIEAQAKRKAEIKAKRDRLLREVKKLEARI